MAVVALEEMEFFAYHGLHEEESVIGTHFILDVWIQTEIKDVRVVNDNDIDQVRIIDLLPYPAAGDPDKINIIFLGEM